MAMGNCDFSVAAHTPINPGKRSRDARLVILIEFGPGYWLEKLQILVPCHRQTPLNHWLRSAVYATTDYCFDLRQTGGFTKESVVPDRFWRMRAKTGPLAKLARRTRPDGKQVLGA
jgi:hypothetical protein